MEKRKIVQIAGTPVHALCNDGTLWVYDYIVNKWKLINPIPQGPVNKDEEISQ